MKKLLISLAVLLFTAFSFSGVAYAAYNKVEDFTEAERRNYEEALNYAENSRTDVYIQDYYMQYDLRNDPEVIAKMLEMTAGKTTDYEKAKAIHKYVSYYAYTLWDKIPEWKGAGGCYYNAKSIEAYMQAAGFPTKYIEGSVNGLPHAWNEVFIDGRWIMVDASPPLERFDGDVIDWSYQRIPGWGYLLEQEKEIWDGSLYFFDSTNWKLLKEVKNFPLNGVVQSTYGFDIKDLYLDTDFTEPFKLNSMKVNSTDFYIMVKRPRVVEIVFDSMGGTAVATQIVETDDWGRTQIKVPKNPTRTGYKFIGWSDSNGHTITDLSDRYFSSDQTLYAKWEKATSKAKTYKVTFKSNKGTSVKALTTTAKSTIAKPKNPTRKGYKFVAWYKDSNLKTKWNFSKDTITKNTTLYAGWVKTYTVTFNSNKGTSVKSVTVTNKSAISKPTNPTRKGYKFVAWYKDAKCTKKWDFAKDKVTANTVLYAGWKK